MQKITSGGYLIVLNGTVISFGSNPIKMEFSPFIEGSNALLTLLFSFLKDHENKEPRMEFRQLGENGLEIIVYNAAGSSFDGGNIMPIEIADDKGKKVYLNFRSRTTGDSRTIDYTIYRPQ
jgi:hypothetical protein